MSLTSPTTAAAASEPQPGVSGGLQTLQGLCQQAALESFSREDFLQRLGKTLQRVVAPDVVVRIAPTDSGTWQLDGLLYPASGLSEEFRMALLRHGEVAIQQQTTQLTRIGRPPNVLLVAVPLLGRGTCQEAIAAVFTSPPATADVLIAVLELVVSQLALWDARTGLRNQEDTLETSAAILDLISRLESSADLQCAANRLVQELAMYLDGPTVALLKPERSRLRLLAYTGGHPPDEKLIDLYIAAGDEALIRGEPGIWPASSPTLKHALLTHRQLAQQVGSTSVVTVPLLDETSQPQGVLVLHGSEQLIHPPDGLQFLNASAVPLASCLKVLQRGERSSWVRGIDALLAKLHSNGGRWALLGTLLLGAALAVPYPYRIACECDLQPVARRFVAAPFEGRLESATVVPGDVVAQGQVLAHLDGREIQWEQEGVQAELHRALKERDGHLASAEYGKAEVARLDSERLRLKSELLTHRSERLAITSPIEGIIVSGDLRKTEGAPVKVGQTLFEVAPLDRMTIEIRIPEREIAYVHEGLPVDVTLDAFPGRHWLAVVERLHPRAQLHQEQQVFLAEVELLNEHELLRPGMQGAAKITSAAHPIGWNLFHHAYERLAMWVGF